MEHVWAHLSTCIACHPDYKLVSISSTAVLVFVYPSCGCRHGLFLSLRLSSPRHASESALLNRPCLYWWPNSLFAILRWLSHTVYCWALLSWSPRRRRLWPPSSCSLSFSLAATLSEVRLGVSVSAFQPGLAASVVQASAQTASDWDLQCSSLGWLAGP